MINLEIFYFLSLFIETSVISEYIQTRQNFLPKDKTHFKLIDKKTALKCQVDLVEGDRRLGKIFLTGIRSEARKQF